MVNLGRWSVYGVRISIWAIIWDRNKTIDIGERSIWGGGQLERFYCTTTITTSTAYVVDFSYLVFASITCV